MLALFAGVALTAAATYRVAAARQEVVAIHPPAGTEWLPHGRDFWRRAADIELVPPIALPESTGGRLRTRVFVHLPPGQTIELAPARSDGLVRLKFPPGTRADRVDYVTIGGRQVVADVRGTEILARGAERFRAFRPEGPSDNRVFGVTWPRGSATSGSSGTTAGVRATFEAAFAHGLGFAGRHRPPDDAAKARYSGLLECAGCHAHARGERLASARGDGLDGGLRRGTDGSGFYTTMYLFRDSAPLEGYRPIDPNARSAFVQYRCDDGTPIVPSGATDLVCASGDVPTLHLDVPAALRAGDARTVSMCRARQRFAAHLDRAAYAAVEAQIIECRGVPSG